MFINFDFCWDLDFFLVSSFIVFFFFFHWKIITLNFLKTLVFYNVCIRSTSVNMFPANSGRLPHFDKNGTYWGELQLHYSYKPLIYDVDMYK